MKIRGRAQPSDLLRCQVCGGDKAAIDFRKEIADQDRGVWIYVDDSNIWIAAKKLASQVKRFKTGEDHRVRIEIGRLTDVVANGRPVIQGFLYGSEPPPVDSVWEKIREKGWEVDRQKRHPISGKEKKVDTKLVADVTERACTTPRMERTTIIFITGDADAIPAIEKVLKYEGWQVEVYMWAHALSSELKKLPERRNNVKIVKLDHVLDRVTFTNMKFDSTNKKLIPQVKAYGVVLSMAPGAFKHKVPTKRWCEQLESIVQWPFQYYWVECDGEPTNDLVLVFREDVTAGVFDMKQFLDILEESHPLPYVERAQTYLQYSQSESGLCQYAFDAVGRYSWDDVCEGSDTESLHVSSKSEIPWELARHSPKSFQRRRKGQRYSDRCRYKRNCKHGINCCNKHTKEEITFFHKNQGRGNPMRKVKPCQRHPNCKKAKEDCQYAHGEDDAWCLCCCAQGHFSQNCPNPDGPF